MAAETQYTANTGIAVLSTANSNLDGTGTLVTLITAAENGTLIKSISVKSTVSTTEGMVRIFVSDGSSNYLIDEIEIPSVTVSSTDNSFELEKEFKFYLKSGWTLKASTQNAETINVIAEGLNWAYYTTSVRSDTTKNTIYNAATTISTANTNLNGTGTMGTALVASNKGSMIYRIHIKSIVNTTDGMVRLFLYDGTSAKLFKEVRVVATTKSAVAKAFEKVIRFPDGFALKSGWQLRASTEKAESFNIVPETFEWNYPL